ncbi:MFS transporter [Streptomyces corynorhini]|uniref:MFS transporter n=2 Tax=Streptomyces corynorhini TaxID=2282652 RepID=A0A370BHM6_9ACTN|nr:MFS transporter [Streptomyces corynorhini]
MPDHIEKTVRPQDVGTEPGLPTETRMIIGVLVVSAFVVMLNETIMSVAMSRLMDDLGIPASTAQWLTTGFLLTMAVVIPVTGFLLQRFHARTLFISAMGLFCVGTLVSALAPGFPSLLAGRVIQASGTAIVIPLLTTTILNLVPADRRGRVMGVVTIVIAVAPAIGPVLSGFILSALDWRWMFWFVLPVALLALAIGCVLLKNFTTPRKVPLDLISVALSAPAFGGLVYGLSALGESADGHSAIPLWIPLTVGSVSLAAFVLRQITLQRDGRALLDLRPFGIATFRVALALLVLAMASLFGSFILLPLYLQNVLGLGTLATGLLLLPGGLLMGAISPFVGRIFDRTGPRPLVVTGSLLLSAALWAMTMYGADTPVWLVVIVHSVLMLGVAMMMTPLMATALGSLPQPLYSHGSATVNTVQQLAGAAGTALFITVMAQRTSDSAARGLSVVAATQDGIQAAFVCGALISLVAVLAALLVRNRGGQAASGEAVIH